MNEKIRVFVNGTTDENAQRSAANLAKQANTEIERMTYPLPLLKTDRTVVIYGGDGSVLSAVEALNTFPDTQERTLIVAPFGSFNGTAEALSDLGARVTARDVVVGNTESQKAIRPGLIGTQLFHHGASWGPMSVTQVIGTEQARGHVPKRVRAYLGALKAAMEHPTQLFKENVVSIAFTSPFLGPFKLIPRQDFEGETVAVATLKGGNSVLPQLSSFLYTCIVKHQLPKNLLEIQISQSHLLHLPKGDETIVVDAELRTLPKNGDIFIRRSEKSIQMAVLKEKENE